MLEEIEHETGIQPPLQTDKEDGPDMAYGGIRHRRYQRAQAKHVQIVQTPQWN